MLRRASGSLNGMGFLMQTDKSRHWAFDYIGCGFSSGSTGPGAYDCWGLVRAVYRHCYQINIDPVICDAGSLRQVRATFGKDKLYKSWVKITGSAGDGDAVLMRQGKFTSHVGLYADVDGGRIVHALPGVGVVAQSINRIEQAGYQIAGIYRHKKRRDWSDRCDLRDCPQSV